MENENIRIPEREMEALVLEGETFYDCPEVRTRCYIEKLIERDGAISYEEANAACIREGR